MGSNNQTSNRAVVVLALGCPKRETQSAIMTSCPLCLPASAGKSPRLTPRHTHTPQVNTHSLHSFASNQDEGTFQLQLGNKSGKKGIAAHMEQEDYPEFKASIGYR